MAQSTSQTAGSLRKHGHVFISHSNVDDAIANAICAALEAAGVACWISERDVALGASYQESIVAAICGGRAMVVLVSEAANASDEVKKELAFASAARVPVYPVRLRGVVPNAALSHELATRQWIEGGDAQGIAARLAEAIQSGTPNLTTSDLLPALALPDKPSLVVLPFQNLSGDPEQEYFVDGIVEEITSALSRTGWLFVIGRNSAFTYKGRAVDLRQVGRELGVRYVLEGSVRRAGRRVRLNCQLIEAATGGHVWADRYEGDLVDIFDLQDRTTESVVGMIEPKLQYAELARIAAKPTESQDAYDYYLRALPHYGAMSRQSLDTAITLLGRALEIDPNYVRAKALLAEVYLMRFEQGWGDLEDRDVALTLVHAMLATGSDDPQVLASAGFAFAQVGDYSRSLTLLNRAIQLHPYNSVGLHYLGLAYLLSGHGASAIGYLESSIRLNPLDPKMASCVGCLGIAYLMVGRNEEAVSVLDRASREQPTIKWMHRHLIHALIRVGRVDDARAAAARLLKYDPDHRIGPLPATNYTRALNEDRHRALRAAGIPE